MPSSSKTTSRTQKAAQTLQSTNFKVSSGSRSTPLSLTTFIFLPRRARNNSNIRATTTLFPLSIRTVQSNSQSKIRALVVLRSRLSTLSKRWLGAAAFEILSKSFRLLPNARRKSIGRLWPFSLEARYKAQSRSNLMPQPRGCDKSSSFVSTTLPKKRTTPQPSLKTINPAESSALLALRFT